MQTLFRGRGFRFQGPTRKIAYAHGLEGVELVPIQALTAVICTACALVGTFLFLGGHATAAFVLVLSVTQGWRALSETLRMDHRGLGRLSTYQVLGLLGVPFGLVMVLLWGSPSLGPLKALQGLRPLGNPWAILLLQALWVVLFRHVGRSSVTEATLTFRVRTDRI